jgi:hypothetical protein
MSDDERGAKMHDSLVDGMLDDLTKLGRVGLTRDVGRCDVCGRNTPSGGTPVCDRCVRVLIRAFVPDLQAEITRLRTATVSAGRLREAAQRAYRFAWRFAQHREPCALALDINAPDDTPCTCGYSEMADALMDDEEANGFDFWKNARDPAALSAEEG